MILPNVTILLYAFRRDSDRHAPYRGWLEDAINGEAPYGAHCTIVQPGPRHWEIFAGLCRSARATGNLVEDAWFAALAIEAGCEWITTERDYGRFLVSAGASPSEATYSRRIS